MSSSVLPQLATAPQSEEQKRSTWEQQAEIALDEQRRRQAEAEVMNVNPDELASAITEFSRLFTPRSRLNGRKRLPEFGEFLPGLCFGIVAGPSVFSSSPPESVDEIVFGQIMVRFGVFW